jgi:hypothetical protein
MSARRLSLSIYEDSRVGRAEKGAMDLLGGFGAVR